MCPRTVKAFLDERHGSRYRIFNLCDEKTYDTAKFDGRVRLLPIPDHQPPSLHQMKNFCYRS